MRRLNELKYPKKKILFLGYDETETKLIHALIHKKCLVDHTSQKVENISKYDFVVSFGYRHIFHIIVVLIQIFGHFMKILLPVLQFTLLIKV